jgi:FlaA1/EpsC-like NDP-sugar epimerase
MLQKEWSLGYRPVAVFDNHLFFVREAFKGAPLLETLTDVLDVAHDQEADTAIFAMPGAHHADLTMFVERASGYFQNIIVIADLPDLTRVTSSAVVARELAGTYGVEIKRDLVDTWAQRGVLWTYPTSGGIHSSSLLAIPLLLAWCTDITLGALLLLRGDP